MKLYVGNLPFSVDDNGLKEIFVAYSPEEAIVIMNKFSGRSKGFGFVTVSDDQGTKAISEMNGKQVEGRELRVSEARPMENRSEGSEDQGTMKAE